MDLYSEVQMKKNKENRFFTAKLKSSDNKLRTACESLTIDEKELGNSSTIKVNYIMQNRRERKDLFEDKRRIHHVQKFSRNLQLD